VRRRLFVHPLLVSAKEPRKAAAPAQASPKAQEVKPERPRRHSNPAVSAVPLVDRCRTQQDQLLALADQLRETISRRDLGQARHAVLALLAKLRVHQALEQECLSDPIRAALSGEEAELAKRLQNDGIEFMGLFVRYSERWGRNEVAADFGSFRSETEAMIDGLTELIQLKRQDLYPIVERANS
jgi:hypothetical protein